MSKNREVVAPITQDEKMEIIRSGKRKRSLTGVKENKNIVFQNQGGKFVAFETERSFEEAAVTKKKENFIMFESILSKEKDVDYTKISGPKKPAQVQERTEERIVQKSVQIPYLDNYQYKESKVFGKNPKPATVIHRRLGDIIGGMSEEYSYQKITTKTGGNVSSQNQTTTKTTTTTTTTKENRTSSNSRTKKEVEKEPGETTATATKTMTQTTKVGRRGGAGGPTSTTTETTSKTTTTRTTRRGVK